MVPVREPKWSKKVPQKSHKIDKNHEKWCPRPPSGQDPEKASKPGVPWRGPCGAYTVNSISNSGPAWGALAPILAPIGLQNGAKIEQQTVKSDFWRGPENCQKNTPEKVGNMAPKGTPKVT